MFAAHRLVSIGTICLMLAFASVASAASSQYFAHLEGNGEPRAEGRAIWEAEGRQMFLSVIVTNVSSTDVVSVHIDGRLVGFIEIQEDGVGMLEFGSAESGDKFRVRPGSTITIHDAVHANAQLPLLVGTFRSR